MRIYVNIVKALACEKRLRMLMALRGGEVCEGELAALVDVRPSTASRHLGVLTNAGLVDSEKRGNCVCYRLALERAKPLVHGTIAWVQACLETDPQILQDCARLARLAARHKANWDRY